MTASPNSHAWIGRTIGDRNRYRISDRLGGGGMGDVFLAVDTLLGQEVAVKMLKEKLLAEGDLRRRFEREVLLCAAIKSDNVVQVKDYGVTPEGYPFFIMEYLKGQTLAQLLRQEKRISPDRTVYIISQVCAGLHFAHSGITIWHDGVASEPVQVIHRDLKPENIFLLPTTLGELVKVLDFGIAKITSNDFAATNTGLFMGTFQYAAPEQLEGRKDLDERADIYSLGMILYEMLSGTDPFDCSSQNHPTGGMAWIRAHISQQPKTLRSQPNCEQIPWELESVVMRCLQKLPNERFTSVDELHQALQQAIHANFDGTTVAGTLSIPKLQLPPPPHRIAPQEIEAIDKDSLPTQALPPQLVASTTSFSDSLTNDIQKQLELALVKYIGPIAGIVIRKDIKQSTDDLDLVERLVHHVPIPQQPEFRATAAKLLSVHNPTSAPPTTAGTSVEKTSSNPKTVTKTTSSTSADTDLPPTPDFINRCEQELANFIGPMARLVVRKAIAQQPSQSQLVERLAQQISDPKQAHEFRRNLL